MKHSSLLRTSLCLLSIISLFPACKKYYDYVKEHRPGSMTTCQLTKHITSVGPTGSPDTITYAYNLAGNPISAVRGSTATGAPDYVFRYNGSNQLTDYIGSYSSAPITDSSVIEVWHKYGYDGSGNIVIDTTFFFPEVSGGQPIIGSHGSLAFYSYDYDSLNRVASVTANFGWGPIFPPTTYTYDAAGNLTGPSSYDSHLNYLRTNKIFQFLARNYSVNNPLPATYTYNVTGYPTHIVYPDGPTDSLEYACH